MVNILTLRLHILIDVGEAPARVGDHRLPFFERNLPDIAELRGQFIQNRERPFQGKVRCVARLTEVEEGAAKGEADGFSALIGRGGDPGRRGRSAEFPRQPIIRAGNGAIHRVRNMRENTFIDERIRAGHDRLRGNDAQARPQIHRAAGEGGVLGQIDHFRNPDLHFVLNRFVLFALHDIDGPICPVRIPIIGADQLRDVGGESVRRIVPMRFRRQRDMLRIADRPEPFPPRIRFPHNETQHGDAIIEHIAIEHLARLQDADDLMRHLNQLIARDGKVCRGACRHLLPFDRPCADL